jgi:hypothetical protein
MGDDADQPLFRIYHRNRQQVVLTKLFSCFLAVGVSVYEWRFRLHDVGHPGIRVTNDQVLK